MLWQQVFAYYFTDLPLNYQVYAEARGQGFDFPKAHASRHLFPHILRKGVTKNYNAKLGEAMHIGLKAAYQQIRKTNSFEAEVSIL